MKAEKHISACALRTVLRHVLSITTALALAFTLPLCTVSAKTIPAGQTVGDVLFYITNAGGEQILVSEIPVSDMEADMNAGLIDDTLHNYSLLDRYVTTVHQEAEGFSVPDFVTYAQGKSPLSSLRGLKLTFAGNDAVRFWEIDQTGFDELDTYTWNQLCGVQRYNFPLIYEYWDYQTQDYYDPAGTMTKDEVLGRIFKNGEPETVLLSVRAFSQRYMVTDYKYGTGDYNMENYWKERGLLDNERTIRVMKPMTKDELYNKMSTASDSRYWTANILLDMENAPSISSLGNVAAPTATMTEDDNNYYIRFSCDTKDSTILYNHNFISPSYTPTVPYTEGTTVTVPKSFFPGGTVTMTARAVKEGYTDQGVVTLTLTSGGKETGWPNPFKDVSSGNWYYDAVSYVMKNDLFDAASTTSFEPDSPMTRQMLVTALYRLEGSPSVEVNNDFSDVSFSSTYADDIQWAYENGIVNGISDTSFGPDESITREQIAAMVMRFAKYRGEDVTASGNLSGFTDYAGISGYARDALSWAVGKNLISGMGDGTIAPKGTTTRAQAAQMLLNRVAPAQ